MKRLICLLLLLSVLCGCGASREEMAQPVKFYYCYANAQSGIYGDPAGALAWEVHDLGAVPLPASEILRRYLQGPAEAGHISPFPKGTAVEEAKLNGDVLTVILSEEAASLTGIDRTLAAACLVKTMTQFADIHGLILEIGSERLWEQMLTGEDFLLLDDTATSDAVTMKLYFGASDGRYLTEETRSRSFQSEEEIPAYIVQQLLEGPQTEDGKALLPEGTRILGIENKDGICTVNVSESFLWYQPSTHLEVRQMVLSVANTLTELPDIACVRFLCGGNPINYYMGMDLTELIYRDETAFGVGRDRKERTDVTLYVPCGKQERLAPVPRVLSQTAGRTLEAEVLGALLSMETINSYVNPFPEGTMVLAVETNNGLCTVTFNAAFAMTDSEKQEQAAVRSVVATLCALENVDRVAIELQNGKLTTVGASEQLSVEPAWLLP